MRVAASVAIAGLIVLGASGCEFITPQDTTRINQVADGMNATVGPIGIRNALMFTTNGTEASLVTSLVNSGSSPQTVSMQYTSTSGPTTQQLTVPANGLLAVRPGGEQVVTLSNIDAKAGSLFPVYFTSGGAATTVKIPVLDASLPGYETLTPTPTPVAIPTSAPAPTPTGTTGGTPAPVDSATPAAG
jgi:hypothetical protein